MPVNPSNDGLFLIDRPDFLTFDIERLPRSVDKQAPSFLGLFPLPREGIDFDSLFDRSKDVLSVVVALLFGVGCGALTAATMYFAWMLVVGRSEDEEEFYDDIPSPKKGGYVKIGEGGDLITMMMIMVYDGICGFSLCFQVLNSGSC
ncbi:hypothetical protein QQ045_021455 [Rhodiola kirilowii]